MRRAITRVGGGARGVVGLVAIAAAILGAVPPVSAAWLAPVLAADLVLSVLFLRLAWRRDPLPPLAGGH